MRLFKKLKFRMRPRAGVTMLEILVATAVLSIILVVLAEIVIIQSVLYRASSISTEVNQYALLPLERVRGITSAAKRIVASYNIGGTLYTSGNTALVVELPSVDSSQNIISGSNDYFVIARDPTDPSKLFARGEIATGSARNGSYVQLAPFVDNAIFRYNNSVPTYATLVDVFLKITRTATPPKPTVAAGLILKLKNQ